MEVLYCFTVAIGLLGDQTATMKAKGRQSCSAHAKQGWLWSEGTVSASGEILGIWAALNEAAVILFFMHQKIKIMQRALFYCDL